MKAHIIILSLALLVAVAAVEAENDRSPNDQKKSLLQPLGKDNPTGKVGVANRETDNKDHNFNKNKEIFKPNEDKRNGRVFFAFYSSTSVTVLATKTQVALSTCFSTISSPPNCVGRKKKKALFLAFPDLGVDFSSLESGLTEADKLTDVSQNREDRKLTLWSTNYSTLTITTTSFISGTTVTVSGQCIIPGVLALPTCFG